MVASKARARQSAVLLLAAPARIPRLRDEVLPCRSIEPSWPGCATATDVKSVSRPARAVGLGPWCAQHARSIQLAISPDDDGHNQDHHGDSRTCKGEEAVQELQHVPVKTAQSALTLRRSQALFVDHWQLNGSGRLFCVGVRLSEQRSKTFRLGVLGLVMRIRRGRASVPI